MIEMTGDIWRYHENAAALVIPTNLARKADGTGIAGAGLALEAAKRFPTFPARIGQAIRQGRKVVYFEDWRLVAFPTKRHPQEPSSRELIRESAEALLRLWGDKIMPVFLPRVGCGLGRLDWAEIGPMLADILDDRFVAMTLGVYVDQLARHGGSAMFPWKESCHLFADTDAPEQDLHRFAASIGLRREWFQNDARLPHYDLNASRRAAAVRAGAVEVTWREMYAQMVRRSIDTSRLRPTSQPKDIKPSEP